MSSLHGHYLHKTRESQSKHRQTPMPREEFKPTIPVFDRAKLFLSLDPRLLWSTEEEANSPSVGLKSHRLLNNQTFRCVFAKSEHRWLSWSAWNVPSNTVSFSNKTFNIILLITSAFEEYFIFRFFDDFLLSSNVFHNLMLETSEMMITIIAGNKITRTLHWPDPNPGIRQFCWTRSAYQMGLEFIKTSKKDFLLLIYSHQRMLWLWTWGL
jgi:hypothetical protein